SVAIAASSIGSILGSWTAASNFERAATTAPPPPRAAASNLRRTNDGRFSRARPADLSPGRDSDRTNFVPPSSSSTINDEASGLRCPQSPPYGRSIPRVRRQQTDER